MYDVDHRTSRGARTETITFIMLSFVLMAAVLAVVSWELPAWVAVPAAIGLGLLVPICVFAAVEAARWLWYYQRIQQALAGSFTTADVVILLRPGVYLLTIRGQELTIGPGWVSSFCGSPNQLVLMRQCLKTLTK